MQQPQHAVAAGKPGGGFGAAASAQTSTTKENGGFSFKPANPSPAGDCSFCLILSKPGTEVMPISCCALCVSFHLQVESYSYASAPLPTRSTISWLHCREQHAGRPTTGRPTTWRRAYHVGLDTDCTLPSLASTCHAVNDLVHNCYMTGQGLPDDLCCLAKLRIACA